VDAVEDGVTGVLVPAGDTSVLRQAIVDLLADDARRAILGQAGRLRASTAFAQAPLEELRRVYDAAAES
jgi:glycosyltransferase involved in cell wall biosynthesis